MARNNRDRDDNDLSGLIYKNPDHQGNRPDMKGMVTVDGRLFWVSGWTKETKRGSKLYDKGIDEFISLSLEPADEQQDRGRSRGRDDDRGGRGRDDRGSRGRDDDRGSRSRDRDDRGRDDDRSARDRDDRGSQDRGDSGRAADGFSDMEDDIPF